MGKWRARVRRKVTTVEVDSGYHGRGIYPPPRQSQLFFYGVLAVMLFLSFLVVQDFMTYIVAGVFVAVLALPIDKFWERLFPNRIAALFTMTTLFLIIAVPLVGLAFALSADATKLARAFQSGELQDLADKGAHTTLGQRVMHFVYPDQEPAQQFVNLHAAVARAQVWATDQLTSFGSYLLHHAPDFFIAFIVILFVVYYVLTDGEALVAYLRRVAPLPPRQVDFLLHEARNGLSAVFVGQILTAIIQGALGGVGFLIAGVPNAALWATVMAVLSLLPVLGTFLVWVPAGIYLLAIGNTWQGIFLLIWGVMIVTILVDNVIRPRLIGKRADIHPIFVLIGVLGGAAVFGFIGLFLGPLLVGVTLAVLKVWEEEYLDPKVARHGEIVVAEEIDSLEAADAASREMEEADDEDLGKGTAT